MPSISATRVWQRATASKLAGIVNDEMWKAITRTRRHGLCPELARVLAGAEIDVPLVTLGKSLNSSGPVADALRGADWQLLDQLRTLDVNGAAQRAASLAEPRSLRADT